MIRPRSSVQRHLGRPQKGARPLDVDGARWWYLIGRCWVPIWSPDGVKHVASITKVACRSFNTLERGQWKKTSDGMICPEHVRRYIRRFVTGSSE